MQDSSNQVPPWEKTLRHTYQWVVGLMVLTLVVASLVHVVVGGKSSATTVSAVLPARVEHLQGAEPSRVTLTESAAKRLDLQTTLVRDVTADQAKQKAIPYAAIIYDTTGNAWTYVNPTAFTFVRHPITVDHIDGDTAFVTSDFPPFAKVVTVGAEELYGSETEFQEE
jgi:hypothetical protein